MKFFTHAVVSLVLLAVGFKAKGKEVFPEIPEKKETLLIQVQSEWYDSISNYKELGKFSRLPHENSFQYLSADPRIKYTPRQWFSIELFGGFMGNWSKTYNSSTNQPTNRKRWWFTSVGMGFSFHKKWQDLYFSIDIKGRAPLNRFDNLTKLIVNGDGAFHIEPGLWIIYALSPHFAYLFYNTSFRYRTEKLSALSYHRAGGLIQTRHFDTGLSANLFFPVISDAYTKRPETRWNVLENVNGGSYKFYSVNPAVLSFTVWANFKPAESIGLQIYGSLDTYGQAYGKGYTVGLMATKKWSFKSSSSSFKKDLKEFERSEDEELNEESEMGDPNEELEEEDEEESEPKKPAINIEISDELNKLE